MKKWNSPLIEELDLSFTMGGTTNSPSETSIMTAMAAKYNKAQGTFKNNAGSTLADLQSSKWFTKNDISIEDQTYIIEHWDNIAVNS